MKINTIKPHNKKINFKDKRPNDSTYHVIKNPQTASDKMEYGFVTDFLRRNPNWEQDEVLVHRLKQDTKGARAIGKIHSQWHEWDIPPALVAIYSSAISVLSLSFLVKNIKNKCELSKYEKFFFAAGVSLGVFLAADAVKYILTGRNLFEKKKMTK